MAQTADSKKGLSVYDQARQLLKAKGKKTPQSMTKYSLMMSMVRSKDPEIKAFGARLTWA